MILCLRRLFKKNKPKTVTTTVAEQQDAEILIFKELQHSVFKNEIASLSHTEQKPKLTTQNRLLRLDPFIDDQGLIRVGGRLGNSTLPFAVKHPIILPRCSHVTELIIDHFHERVKHQRKGMTMFASSEKKKSHLSARVMARTVQLLRHDAHCPM